MARTGMSFLVMSIILAFALVSFVYVVFSFTGLVFTIEFFLLLTVILLMSLGMYNILRERRWGWTTLTVVSIILIINIALIFLASRTISRPFAVSFLFAFLGFIIAFLNIKGDLSPVTKAEISEKFEKSGKYYENSEKR